jgi:hypothetical protein
VRTDEPSLPSNRAFVVQFYAKADGARGGVAGRVEHLDSGRADHFHSFTELKTFFLRVLSDIEKETPKKRRLR